MNRTVFTINDHYRVYPALNQVQDLQTGHIRHLEPRIMAVLEYLTRHAGELVTREEMVRDIWNNYGGGDDGLSQAISFLRKILDDREKRLIQTVPKKGYRLAAVPGVEIQDLVSGPAQATPNIRSLFKTAISLYVICTVAYFLYNGLRPTPRGAEQKVSLIASIEPLPAAIHPTAKNLFQDQKHNKTRPTTRHLKRAAILGNQKPTAPADNPLPTLSLGMETKSYHLRDTTAQMSITLDYQITTTLRASTTIN